MRKVRLSRIPRKDADLDITAFMNLMIVLVPVLLLGMVFSQITVIDLKLPESAAEAASNETPEEKKEIELVIREDALLVNYPKGILLKRIPQIPVEIDPEETAVTAQPAEQPAEQQAVMTHDFKMLSLVLQEVKRQLREQSIENRAITILSEQDTHYQTIVSAMDAVRSYKAVVVTSVVDAELFPEISFGDAPQIAQVGGVQ